MHTTAMKIKRYACELSHPIYRCPTFFAVYWRMVIKGYTTQNLHYMFITAC